jgi:hypothetical protein
MLKKLLLVVALLVVAVVIVVGTRPETYHVERSAKIDAPAEAVFAAVSDFRTFPEWSPWQKRDPAVRTTVSTPSAGVGASYAWQGNKDVGKGRMTITESRPPSRVRERLEFIEPFASVAETGFDVKPEGPTAAAVTWSMDGKNNFMGKAFSLVMDMDKMIGKDFDAGLANLKRLVEAQRPATPPPTAPGAAAAATAPGTW